MKRPAFQFYTADWRNNAKLRRCSHAARGAWMDVLCVLHDSDEYGVCRWPLADIARSAGVPLRLLRELADKDVLKGADKDADAFVHVPTHAGKKGDAVTLVAKSDGPVWYCSRLVRDEWLRDRRGAGTRFDTDNQPERITLPTEFQTPTGSPNGSPTRRVGERQGDGASSSSSSTTTKIKEKEKEKKEKEKETRIRALTTEDLVLDGLHEDTAAEFIRHRRAKKAPLTPLAWKTYKAEAQRAGWTVEDAVKKSIHRGWISFEAAWVLKDEEGSETPWQRAQRERIAELTGGLACAKPPSKRHQHAEVIDASYTFGR